MRREGSRRDKPERKDGKIHNQNDEEIESRNTTCQNRRPQASTVEGSRRLPKSSLIPSRTQMDSTLTPIAPTAAHPSRATRSACCAFLTAYVVGRSCGIGMRIRWRLANQCSFATTESSGGGKVNW